MDLHALGLSVRARNRTEPRTPTPPVDDPPLAAGSGSGRLPATGGIGIPIALVFGTLATIFAGAVLSARRSLPTNS